MAIALNAKMRPATNGVAKERQILDQDCDRVGLGVWLDRAHDLAGKTEIGVTFP